MRLFDKRGHGTEGRSEQWQPGRSKEGCRTCHNNTTQFRKEQRDFNFNSSIELAPQAWTCFRVFLSRTLSYDNSLTGYSYHSSMNSTKMSPNRQLL